MLYMERKANSKYTVRGRKQRQRQVGGGRHRTLDLRTRLLVYLFWLHLRPAQSVLCQMYGLSRGCSASIISDMHINLGKLPTYAAKNYPKDHGRIHTLDTVLDTFPELKPELKDEECRTWRNYDLKQLNLITPF